MFYNLDSFFVDGRGKETRGIFGTYPNREVKPSMVTLAFDEMLGTALLLVFNLYDIN